MATFAELAVALGVAGTVTATALPPLLTSLDDARVAGAARYLSSRLAEARMDAVSRSSQVALRFSLVDGLYTFAVYRDGNHNGVLTRDIERGIDPLIFGPEKLSHNFRNVEFGVQPGLPPIQSGDPSPAGDPIKLGAGNSVSFSTLGSATSGTIYITGPSRAQFAVRVFGATGKIRAYRFDRRTGKWLPM